MMFKYIRCFTIALIMCTVLCGSVNAYSANEQPELQTENYVIEIPQEWQEIIDDAPITYEEFQKTGPENMIEKILTELKYKMLEPLRLFARICAVIILVSLAKSVSNTGAKTDILNLLEIIAAITVFTICSTHVLALTSDVHAAIQDGNVYMTAFIPVFATIIVSSGYVGTSAVYSGTFFAVCALITTFFNNFIIPCTRILLAMHATSAVDTALDLSKLAHTFSRWLKWMLTIVSALFVTVLGLQTTLASNADSAALKAGKFLLGSTIPVVGRAVSDAMGTVLAGLKVVKGSLGFAAIAVVLASVLPIILQCVAYYLTFVMCSFVAGATGNNKTEKMFVGFASCVGIFITVMLLFAAMITVATSMMIILGTGG